MNDTDDKSYASLVASCASAAFAAEEAFFARGERRVERPIHSLTTSERRILIERTVAVLSTGVARDFYDECLTQLAPHTGLDSTGLGDQIFAGTALMLRDAIEASVGDPPKETLSHVR